MRYVAMLVGCLIVAFCVFTMIANDIATLIWNAGWWALIVLAWPTAIGVAWWRGWTD